MKTNRNLVWLVNLVFLLIACEYAHADRNPLLVNGSGMGWQLLQSSYSGTAVSTITVSFSTRSALEFVFASSGTSIPSGVMVQFNGCISSRSYYVDLTTSNIHVSSKSALGVILTSTNSTTSKTMIITIHGNNSNWFKSGTFSSILQGTLITNPTVFVSGGFTWYNNESISSAKFTLYPLGGTFSPGVTVTVSGQNY